MNSHGRCENVCLRNIWATNFRYGSGVSSKKINVLVSGFTVEKYVKFLADRHRKVWKNELQTVDVSANFSCTRVCRNFITTPRFLPWTIYWCAKSRREKKGLLVQWFNYPCIYVKCGKFSRRNPHPLLM